MVSLSDQPNMRRADSHKWLRQHYPLTGRCKHCDLSGIRTHRAYKFHPEPYTKNPDDYIELCPKCHGRFDGYFGRARHEREQQERLAA